MPELIFNSVKEYPMFIQVHVYRNGLPVSHEPKKKLEPVDKVRKLASLTPAVRKIVEREEEVYNHNIEAISINRTRQTVEDICLCNEFEWFVTFTFDPKRYNNAKLSCAKSYMTTWLHNAKARHSPNLQYLVIPEPHKSGAWHFHALLSHFEGHMTPTKHSSNGRPVYNVKNWMFGFSTAVKIDDNGQEAVSRYVRKYITKEMLSKDYRIGMGKRRFLASCGLMRPEKHTDYDISFLRKNIPHTFFPKKDVEVYTISKAELAANNLPTSLDELRALPLTGNVL